MAKIYDSNRAIQELQGLLSKAQQDIEDLQEEVEDGGSGPPSGPAGGQLGGTYPNPDVRGLRETSGPTQLTMGAVANGQYLTRSGATIVGAAGGGPPSGAAGGQLGGTYPNPDVRGIRETSGPTNLTTGAIANGQILVRSGATLIGQTGAAPTGAAGGQLGGTYPNPDVRGLRETSGPTNLTMGAVADGDYLVRSGSNVVGRASTVLWSWNQIDGSQFTHLKTVNAAGPPGTIASPTVTFDNTAGQGNLLKFGCTVSGGNAVGVVAWSINDLPTLPKRYILFFRYAGFVPATNNPGQITTGGWLFSNGDAADLLGFSVIQASYDGTLVRGRAEGSASVAALAPFVPSESTSTMSYFDNSFASSGVAPHYGAVYRHEVLQQTATATENTLPLVFTQCLGAPNSASTSIARSMTTDFYGATPGAQFDNENDLNEVAVMLYLNPSESGTPALIFSEMWIETHPGDRS